MASEDLGRLFIGHPTQHSRRAAKPGRHRCRTHCMSCTLHRTGLDSHRPPAAQQGSCPTLLLQLRWMPMPAMRPK